MNTLRPVKTDRFWRRACLAFLVSTTLAGTALIPCTADGSPYSRAHRHRLEFGMGYWGTGYRGVSSRDLVGTRSSSVVSGVFDVSYSYWTSDRLGSFGGHLGIGLDIQMGSHLMLDVHPRYNLMADFREPLAGERNVNGAEFGAGVSFVI